MNVPFQLVPFDYGQVFVGHDGLPDSDLEFLIRDMVFVQDTKKSSVTSYLNVFILLCVSAVIEEYG